MKQDIFPPKLSVSLFALIRKAQKGGNEEEDE